MLDYVQAGLSYGYQLYNYGMETYNTVSPHYTSFLLYKYGNETMDPSTVNFTSAGNLALTVLSMPEVQESIASGLEGITGMDKETLNFYVQTAATALSVAASTLSYVAPKISAYLAKDNELDGKVAEINKSVEKINESVAMLNQANQQKNIEQKENKKEPTTRIKLRQG